MIQGLESINWGNWIPIIVSIIALVVTVLGHKRKAKRYELDDLREKIKVAEGETEKVKKELGNCEQENQILRRDKYALLERIASRGSVRESDKR